MAVKQHKVMVKMIRQDMDDLYDGKLDPMAAQMSQAAIRELGILEEQLEAENQVGAGREVKAHSADQGEEVLQTRTASLEEMKGDLAAWTPAFAKEVEDLTNGPVSRTSWSEVQRMRENGVDVEVLPMKAVGTVKPPGRKKGRVVVCGNMAEHKPEDVSVGGVCSMTLRGGVHAAALRSWSIGTVDVKGAFLQAPRRQGSRLSATEPPALLRAMGLTQPQELWLVHQALYGFVESPADWAIYRDQQVKAMRWDHGCGHYQLKPTGEPHLWKLVRSSGEGEGPEEQRGLVAIYVDDMMVLADHPEMMATLEAIGRTFKCSPAEIVGTDEWVRFCGYELKAIPGAGGFHLRQSGYIRDLLARYEVQGTEVAPAPKIVEGEDEVMDLQALRQAQTVTGELMWLTGRTRPDLSYSVGLMSRALHRRPKYVGEIGRHVLRYLNGSPDDGLTFKSSQGTIEEPLVIGADTSFAPPHEQFRSIQGITVEHHGNLLMWESSRQPFICQSTSEAELLGYNTALQVGESVHALPQALNLEAKKTEVLGDNKAALSLCNSEIGAWRTRHLRLRSARLREILSQPSSGWTARHCPGSELTADGLTKSLLGQAFQKFRKQLRIYDADKSEGIHGEAEVGTSRKAVEALAASAATLCLVGHPIAGGLVALCALVIGDKKGCQEAKKKIQDPKEKKREAHVKKMKEDGWATPKDGKLGTGGAAKEDGWATPKDGKPGIGGAAKEDGVATTGLGLSRSPGIRALRTEVASGSHGRRWRMTGRAAAAEDVQLRAEGSCGNGAANVAEAGETQHHAEGYPGNGAGHVAEDGEGQRHAEGSSGDGAGRLSGVWRRIMTLRGSAGSYGQPVSQEGLGETEATGNEQASESFSWVSSVEVSETRAELDQAEAWLEDPWCLPEFSMPGKASKDRWVLSLWERGWLVREHRRPRHQPFRPLHGTTPCNGDELTWKRITSLLDEDQNVEIIEDEWKVGRSWTRSRSWRGFTFFQRRGPSAASRSEASEALSGSVSDHF